MQVARQRAEVQNFAGQEHAEELSLVSQLAEVSEVLPTRPDQYSLSAFRVPENSGNQLYATPEKRLGVGSVVT